MAPAPVGTSVSRRPGISTNSARTREAIACISDADIFVPTPVRACFRWHPLPLVPAPAGDPASRRTRREPARRSHAFQTLTYSYLLPFVPASDGTRSRWYQRPPETRHLDELGANPRGDRMHFRR